MIVDRNTKGKWIKRLTGLSMVTVLCFSLNTIPVLAEGVENTGAAIDVQQEVPVEPQQLFVPQNVVINGRTVLNTESFLNFNNTSIVSFDVFKVELSQFPLLNRVELCGSNLSNAQMEDLQHTYPNVKFVWSIKLGNYWTIRTDQVAFSTNKGPGPNLTNADTEQLKYCTDLVALDIGHNAVSDISFVRYMPNLRILILVDNRVRDLTPIESCKNLVYLETFVNPITDITPLTNLVNLIDLNISYNRFNDIQPLLNKPRLERLFVSHTGLSMAQINELQAEYPNIHVEYQVTQSIDGGWRKVDRYKAMRTMFKTNTVSDLFMTNVDRLAYYSNVFQYDYYVQRYPEVVAAVGADPITLLDYFIDHGLSQGQQASPTFSIVDYATFNPNLVEAFGLDYNLLFKHYMTRGFREPRICINPLTTT